MEVITEKFLRDLESRFALNESMSIMGIHTNGCPKRYLFSVRSPFVTRQTLALQSSSFDDPYFLPMYMTSSIVWRNTDS